MFSRLFCPVIVSLGIFWSRNHQVYCLRLTGNRASFILLSFIFIAFLLLLFILIAFMLLALVLLSFIFPVFLLLAFLFLFFMLLSYQILLIFVSLSLDLFREFRSVSVIPPLVAP
jgi:hypothetical protein